MMEESLGSKGQKTTGDDSNCLGYETLQNTIARTDFVITISVILITKYVLSDCSKEIKYLFLIFRQFDSAMNFMSGCNNKLAMKFIDIAIHIAFND